MEQRTTSGNCQERRWPSTTAGRVMLGGYSAAGYLLSLISVAYLSGFLADVGVPKGIDTGPAGSTAGALVVDGALVLVFALQHSVMARPWFKESSSRLVRPPAQRSTYVLATSAALLIMFWLWRPIPTTVWQISGWPGEALLVVYAAAVLFTIAATFQVSHTDLFGLRQTHHAITRRPYADPPFTRTGLHARMRHPITAGLLLVVWVTPHLSVGHLLLATGITGYIVLGTRWEERDLLTSLGHAYAEYRQHVPAFLPLLRRQASRPGTSTTIGSRRHEPARS
jgi:protein-S-isoprenylcysteine O-methyltransferase Ste14